jgi:hypothetical protein
VKRAVWSESLYWWLVEISGMVAEKEASSRATASFWLGKVRGVAMNV